ncbi:hypothetical protein FF38_01410 [Lucilia cuprina]|uniref:Uncharacterized protein n=1 Tax=Lucilia cuprina TaxID=7375 RepID=A0A0L0CAD8_LUCCU|nr:hypothetical protein FF38_01410 [Lucilia cuprina]
MVRESFSNLQKWIEEVRRYTASSVMLIVVGNKCDLEDEREVEFEEAQQMCQYIPEVLLVMETSAKENRNVDDAFVTLASELKRRIDTSIRQEENADDEAIKLGHSKPLRQCSSSCNLTFRISEIDLNLIGFETDILLLCFNVRNITNGTNVNKFVFQFYVILAFLLLRTCRFVSFVLPLPADELINGFIHQYSFMQFRIGTHQVVPRYVKG